MLASTIGRWAAGEWNALRSECASRQPGDHALQVATVALVFMASAWLFSATYLVFWGTLNRFASLTILLLALSAASGAGALFGRQSLVRSLVLLIGVYIATALAASWLVDVSYDGQDYHYTAIWALVHGWNPYHSSDFGDFVAPGSDQEMWAFHFPKGHWLLGALQVSAGLGYEAAKTQPMLLVVASFAATLGTALRFGAARRSAIVLAALVALNPMLITELFSRMNDGVMAGYYNLFVAFGLLACVRGERRAMLAILVLVGIGLNTKQSGILILAMLCGWLCVMSLIHAGWRVAVGRGALLGAAGLFSLGVIGADPYVRNQFVYGHFLYPMRGAPDIVINDEYRPARLYAHSDPVRLGMSLMSRTVYANHAYKLPFAIEESEFELAGDPEVHLAGLGPWFSGVFLFGLLAALLVLLQRPPLRSLATTLVLTGGLVALSAFAMPESWSMRYVPQLWLVPLLFAAAVAQFPRRLWAAWLCVLAAVGNIAIVAASTMRRQGGASLAIAQQIARAQRAGGRVSADVGASPARKAVLEERGLTVDLREGNPGRCNVEVMPLAYDYQDDGTRPATMCDHR